MSRWTERVLRILYPVRCPFCDEIVPRSEGLICSRCRTKVQVIKAPYCMKCGKEIEKEEKELCNDCLRTVHSYDRGRSLLVYDGNVRGSIYRFKYKGRKEYAKAYAELVEKELGAFVRSVNPDALVPVPLYRKRYRKRGYNQSELLAKEIGRLMEIPVERRLVSRVKNTIPQKLLDLAQRQKNLKKAFKINGNDVKLNTIIIIDDIYTTGSTIDALSVQFRKAGVKRIFFLTLSGGK